ncbi:MAG: hypothetical protein GY866_43070 [Proteobacteria bacterium]|nr:hypothetical protein [Pseudomonadota bacterium]
MKRGKRRKIVVSEGQIAFDEMTGLLEFYRNKTSEMLFVRVDEEFVVNPDGKFVKFRSEFYEEIESDYWELSEAQRSTVRKALG